MIVTLSIYVYKMERQVFEIDILIRTAECPLGGNEYIIRGIRACRRPVADSATVRIGVSGQRTLADEQQVATAIRQVLERLNQILRDTPHRYAAISSLSEGRSNVSAPSGHLWKHRRPLMR